MRTPKINLNAFNLRDFGMLQKTIPIAPKKNIALVTHDGLEVTNLESGPLGGDQQIGSRIFEGKSDFLIFFWDPLEAQPHDPDVKALLRLAVVWNVPMACNRASADFLISSALMSRTYDRLVPDYDKYRAQSEASRYRANQPFVSAEKQGDVDSKLQ